MSDNFFPEDALIERIAYDIPGAAKFTSLPESVIRAKLADGTICSFEIDGHTLILSDTIVGWMYDTAMPPESVACTQPNYGSFNIKVSMNQ